MANKSKSLKSKNLIWLCSIAVADALIFILLATSTTWEEEVTSKLLVSRLATGTIMPVVVLLATALLSHDMKARIVFTRWHNPLPGCRAFSEYIYRDSRIDVKTLESMMGEFPKSPAEQNSKWYSLYSRVKEDVAVQDAHGAYLLFRDMAAFSIIALIVMFIAALFTGLSATVVSTLATIFSGQFLCSIICARNAGQRFVTTVLTLSSLPAISKTKAKNGAA